MRAEPGRATRKTGGKYPGASGGRVGVTAVLVAAGCTYASYQAPPIQVAADEVGIAALAGEWAGSYRRDAGDRHGTLYFRLELGADTARGELLMFSDAGAAAPDSDQPSPSVGVPNLLTVRFVRAEGDRVSGELDPYMDPVCGCRVRTTFEGRIEGWRVSGTFRTGSVDLGPSEGGIWEARRRRGPVHPEALQSEPGLPGPTRAAMSLEGKRLFRSLGCVECHGADRLGRDGPSLADVARHRQFGWIYHMILRPDSMVRDDPTARRMYERFDLQMRVTGASPWDALVLYEFLAEEIERSQRADPPR